MQSITVNELVSGVRDGKFRSIARAITLIENQQEGYEELLLALNPDQKIPVIGITGSPGAGKSTLLNAILLLLAEKDKKVAVVAIDPSSPFHLGALLGDRIRMHTHANNPGIFIRSLASRGNLGGLSAKTIEVVDLLKSCPFDYIFVETVGVGQSEVEIAGLADQTVLVTTPDSGDDVQLIKAGIMEIASIFVVNKTDRDPEGKFLGKLKKLLANHQDPEASIPVIPIQSNQNKGIEELMDCIAQNKHKSPEKKAALLAAKTINIIRDSMTSFIDQQSLQKEILRQLNNDYFNIYAFAKSYLKKHNSQD